MSNNIVKYEAGGEQISLTAEIIRKTLDVGKATDQEIEHFIQICKFQKLNPFIRDAYLIKYDASRPANIVTGKETFTKRAANHPKFRGYQAGVIVLSDGKIINREGSFYIAGKETLLGGWAKVQIAGWDIPVTAEVALSEYMGQGLWKSKPATMIRKVALVQAIREAFPDEFAGLYSPEEINTVQVENLPITRVDDPILNKMLSGVGRKHHPDYLPDEYLDEMAKFEEAEFEEETELISADQVKALHEKYLHHAQIVGAILNDHDIKGAKNIPAFMLDGIIEEIEEAIELNEEAEADQKRIGDEG